MRKSDVYLSKTMLKTSHDTAKQGVWDQDLLESLMCVFDERRQQFSSLLRRVYVDVPVDR